MPPPELPRDSQLPPPAAGTVRAPAPAPASRPDVRPAQRAALAWVGRPLVDGDGDGVGWVSAILVDRESGQPLWLHVDVREGPVVTTVVVPAAGLDTQAKVLQAPHPRDRLLGGPPGTQAAALGSQAERSLCEHFGLELTRGAALSAWERRRTTSRLRSPGVWDPAPRDPTAGRRPRSV